jgi:uncharacterized repeat protein (TIGR01451 family)
VAGVSWSKPYHIMKVHPGSPLRWCLAVFAALLTTLAGAATFTVTVTNDSGAGSLRQAMLDANASVGADSIVFNITTGTTIPAATNLPPITDPVTIDATTQPGWVSAPIIELNGTNIGGAGQDGFKIWAGSTTIRGLVINRFTGDGIEIATNGNNVIEGCYIGTGLSGTNDLGNTLCGVFITNSTFNIIGSTNTGLGNVISGNNQQGILIGGSSSFGNQILGNLIGLGANGSNTVANSQNGIHVQNSRSNLIGGTVSGARNVISGNSQAGIRVELAQAFGNQMLGNYIGLEIAGGTNRANGANGITLINAPSNSVGNATSAGRNVIAGNTSIGISVSTANNTTIQGNYIGTDATGTLDRGNTTDGITVTTSLNVVIGGTNASEANLISGNNNDGIELSGLTTSFATVHGNLIGTDVTGTNALGNIAHGIQFTSTARTNIIGGVSAGEANIIAFNGADGVFVGSGSNNVVRGNSLFSNTGLGIDIGASGVQANDSFDTDTGDNQLMNYPVLVSASNSPTDTVIEFRMNSWTNITVDIDFYANALPDASGNGEGQFYLGSTNALLPNADSNLVFAVSLPTGPLTVRHITATATDANGNTSEFSPSETLVSSVAGQTFTVINTNGSGAGSLRQAILDANLAVTAGDTIAFDIPGTGPFLMNPGSALPALTDTATTIDGFTQTNSAANTLTTSNNAIVLIRLDGSGLGTVDGLKVANSNCVIRGLSITRFGSDGIELATNASNCRIEGCFLGVTPDGTNAANTANGILVNSVANTIIGGTNAAARNVISANGSDGLELSGTGATGTTVLGNLIGLAPNGVTDRGNSADGVLISGAPGNTIGGAADGARNVISGNASDGIALTGTGSSNNVVLGNYLGTEHTGTTGVPNDSYGVNIAASVTGSVIGSPGAGNVIAFNGLDGVGIPTVSPAPTNNAIRANSIFNNDDLGIDLQTNGISLNDLTDSDTGANNQQNYPVLSAVTNTGTDTTFHGVLNGSDLSAFTFDFFANSISDASGNGEGQFYLGSTNFNTGVSASNTHTFALTLPVTNLPGRYITATATDASGNSSEFSPALAAVSTIAGATYTVINTNDSGAGSLREAILFANTNITAGDTIHFNIPGAGEQIIKPLTRLPVIIDPVTIDGYTQPGSVTNSSTTGFNGTVLVRLEAAAAGAGAPGLRIAAGSSTVRGLIITRCPGDGIELSTNGNNTIIGCIIGLDSTGADFGNTNAGIVILGGGNNTIGGTSPDARNVISGNNTHGIEIVGPGGNVILGNLIGTDHTGALDRGNTTDGVSITGSPGNTIGGLTSSARNLISGNNSDGVQMATAGASNNVVLGNYIGLDVTGTTALGNGGSGVNISAVPHNTVGGTAPGAGNVISANNDGVSIASAGATNNVVEGNYVGTDASGTLDRGNTDNGIIINSAMFNRVGGTTTGARNHISGNNGDGILLTAVGAGTNYIYGNWIGLGMTGGALGNGGNGVLATSSARGNRIGGPGAGEANVIANNSGDGVQVASGTNNAIRLNTIYSNGDLGIDLGTTGVTANDAGDTDTGANQLQNFPVITAATNGLSTIIVEGVLSGWATTTFAMDVYANASVEASGAGEGQVYLGSTNVTTDGSGNVSFSVVLAGTLTGRYLTATATDPLGNTSEFSTQFFAASDILATNFVVINTNDAGPGSLRDAITNANSYISAGNDTISFAIPGAGPHTISPASALPALIDPVTIDGFTQANAAANTLTNDLNTVLQILLDGSGAGAGVDGLQVAASGCVIRGLAINGFTQDGVDISRGTGSSIEGCFIGLNTDGVTRRANNGSGINISASTTSANLIGGETPAARNLISANTSYGVTIASSRQNVIAGNLIGTDLTGMLDRGNTNSGVLISGSTAVLNLIGGTNAAARNVLSGNGEGFLDASGVTLSGCISNFVYGNYCGVNVAGTAALGNTEHGVDIINAAHTNFIGAAMTGAGNVISGNPNAGVGMFGGSTSIGNVIQGNRIGTDASGLTAIANLNRGILVGTARGTLVGGANPNEGNLISGNTYYGVDISCCGTTNTRIFGNWIGTDATGTNALPNEIGVDVGSPDNAIGGTNTGEGNRIWFNTDYGVYISSSASRVAMLGNSFHANGDLAIDLEGNGVTLNDAGDIDSGANARQNFPVITFALTDTNANTLAVPGTFNGASNSTFRLEFFASPAKDATGYGEGRDYLGTTNLTTDASGNASYVFETSPAPPTGWFIAATATTTNGSTSEFSAATKVVPFDSVDLQITLTVSTNPASIALGFNYTNTVVNAGPTNATGVLVTNLLPAGISVVSSNASQGSVSTAPGLVVWNAGNLDYGSNALLVLAVNGGSTGLATNTATVTSVETDHTTENSTTNKVITLGIADLAISIVDSPDPVIAGQSLTLVTTLTNLGPDPATLVAGYLNLPASLIVTSAVVSQGSFLNGGSFYTWNAGTLAVGNFATFTFIGIPTAQGVVNTSASTSKLETDPVSANSEAYIATTVDSGAGILQFMAADYNASESGGSASVVVQRTGGSIGTVTVDLFTSDLTASAGSDYTGTNVTLTFTNGEAFQFVSFPLLDDLGAECNELFSVALTNPTGGALTLLTTNASVLIFDNELSASGGITLASRGTNGASGDSDSYYEAFPSADGRFVAFSSEARNLIPGDTNNTQDIFIINVTNGAISLVSAALSGTTSGNDYSEQPRISADGRFVAFYSESTNLVAGATNRFGDIFLRDTVAGSTRLISVSTHGTGGGNDYSASLRMTPDARFVVFASYSTNLVLNDLNGFDPDVYLRDTNSGNVELISVNGAGTGSANDGSYSPVVSADGRYVAFESTAGNLGPVDTNFDTDVYVRDRNLGSNYLCSVALGGGSANDYSYDPIISSNGAIVLFYSSATNLVAGNTSGRQQIYAYDITNQTVQLVTINTNGTGANDHSYSARLSADGRYVAFESYASDIVANDLNGDYGDIFLRDLVGGTTTLISINCSGTGSGNSDSYVPALSDDGRHIAFNSVASDLAPGDFSAGYEQIFRHDRLTGQTVLVSQNASTTGPGDSYSYYAEMNADGRIVAFITDATDLTTNSYAATPNAMFWDVDAAPPVIGSVNLFLAKTASTGSLVEFTALTYSLAITNLGTLAASGVVVTDALPASLSFISATTSAGTITNNAGLVTASLGALATSSNALITITAMPTNSGLITNIAFAAASETDAAPADNTGSVIVTVTAFPPPTLSTLRTNSQVLILWPSNVPPVFLLETKTNLGPAFTWSAVTNSVAILGTNNAVTLTPDLSERTRFFRLQR